MIDGPLRLERPERSELVERCIAPGRPAVLTGLLDTWPHATSAPFRWLEPDAEYVVDACEAEDATLRYAASTREVRRPLRALLDAIQGPVSPTVFAAQVSLVAHPWMMKHVHLPTVSGLVDLEKIREANFWLQGAGNFTHLHYDGMDNLHFLVHGTKRFVFHPPDQLPRMYSVRNTGGSRALVPGANWSLVDAQNVDHARFPEFGGADSLTIDLRGGETLFLPNCWWHHVWTDAPSAGFNFWFPRRAPPGSAPWYSSWYLPASADD